MQEEENPRPEWLGNEEENNDSMPSKEDLKR
jgi:hypothetical protein